MSEIATRPIAEAEPLFKLDLGENGGLFAPTTLAQATAWIQIEQVFWSWIQNRSYGNHDQGIRQAVEQLNPALNHVQQALQYKDSNPQQYQAQVTETANRLSDIFIQRKLPHSSTALAKRIEAYRKGAGDLTGSYLAAVFVPPEQGHHFQPQDLAAWRGLIEGLIDRYNLGNAPLKGRKQAADQSFEQLRTKAETLLGEKILAYDELHRNYDSVAKDIATSADNQIAHFNTAQDKREADFLKLVDEHKDEMEQLRKTFREEIALRAPADYWETKRKGHVFMSPDIGWPNVCVDRGSCDIAESVYSRPLRKYTTRHGSRVMEGGHVGPDWSVYSLGGALVGSHVSEPSPSFNRCR